jgi:hypothetical protein
MGRKKRRWRGIRKYRPGIGQRRDWVPSRRIRPGRTILAAWYEPKREEELA